MNRTSEQDRVVTAQQTAIPPLAGTVAVAGYDPVDSQIHLLNLDFQRQLQALAERLHATDRLDSRNRVQAVIAAGSNVGAVARQAISVPVGEVWFLNRMVLTSPAESGVGVGDIVQVNVKVSLWPESGDADGKSYFPGNQGTAALDTITIDVRDDGELGEELRLPGGSKLTLIATLTGAAAGADLTATLIPYGRKGKAII